MAAASNVEQRAWMLGEAKEARCRILVINPNSSASITAAMTKVIEPRLPHGVSVTCATAPTSSPPSINDPPTSIASTHASLEGFKAAQGKQGEEGVLDISRYDGVLVACFSAHPLVPCLRHTNPLISSMHILESAVSAALNMSSSRFGILTTGRAMVPDIDAGVRFFLGGNSDRYAGTIATGLPVLYLQDPEHREEVEKTMRNAAAEMAKRGADAMILGCAGMAGMEAIVRSGVAQALGEEQAKRVAVIDGTVVGVHLLAGLAQSGMRG